VAPAIALTTDLLVLCRNVAGSALSGHTRALNLLRNLLLLLFLLGARRDVLVGRLLLDVAPDAIHHFLLGPTHTKSVLFAECIENFLGAVAKIVRLLCVRGVVQFLGLLLGGGGLYRNVLDVLVQITDAALDQLLEILGNIGIKFVVSDELLDAVEDRHLESLISWKLDCFYVVLLSPKRS